MQPGLLFFTVYCHQPWGIVAPCQKQKAFLSSDILFEDKNSHVNLVVALNTTPSILPNPPCIQRFCFVVLVALFVKLGTLQIVTQNVSAAKTRAEHLWPSCRNSLPSARLPSGIYPLPPDTWKGNIKISHRGLWPRKTVKSTKSHSATPPRAEFQSPWPQAGDRTLEVVYCSRENIGQEPGFWFSLCRHLALWPGEKPLCLSDAQHLHWQSTWTLCFPSFLWFGNCRIFWFSD